MNIHQKQRFAKQQIKTASNLLRSADCYLQTFIKFPEVGIFHSRAELLHAALLEADPEVISFVPQPFKLMVNGSRYIPDCYVAYKNKREVIELKPRGEFDEAKLIPLVEHFKQKHGADFKVVSNESVFEQELKAQNWLFIIRTLANMGDVSTNNQEQELLERFFFKPKQRIGDVVQINNRMNAYLDEIALYRLIHQGKLSISHDKPIDTDTEVTLCD